MKSGTAEECLDRWGRVDSNADLCRYVEDDCIPLSSGQITFLRFAAQVSLFIENGTFVLIEEPETHLHPNMITQFVRLLNDLLAMTGSYAILATHSVYFVREVPRSQVVILRETTDSGVEACTPRLKTMGADIGAISHFVFGDDLHGHLLERLRQDLTQSEDPHSLLKSYEEELSPEAVMLLRQGLNKRQIQ